MACYKDLQKHKDPDMEETSLPVVSEKPVTSEFPTDEGTHDKNTLPLATASLDRIYEESPELKELLGYNTVKFHLAKVCRILATDVADTGDSCMNMSSDMSRQLAIDYLNTLRYGGIHYNEAIEEFCQIYLSKVEEGI